MAGLGLNFGLIVAYLINFVILIVALRAFAYKPVLAMLERRKQEIAEGLNAANKVREEAEQERARFESELQKARQASQEEASQIAKATAEMRENILAEAREEAEAIKVRARAEIEAEREAMYVEIRRQMADLTVSLTRRVIGQSLDEQKQRDLVGQFLTELGD